MKWGCRLLRAAALVSALVAIACASNPARPRLTEPYVSGPGAIGISGNYLYVEDEFGRALRRIDLRSRRNERMPIAVGDFLKSITTDDENRLIISTFNESWHVDAAGRLTETAKPDLEARAEALTARLPEFLDAEVGGWTSAPSGDMFLTTYSEYAIGRRIWRVSPSGVFTTLVGPWTVVAGDPKQHGYPWYPKSLGSPVLDGHGGLWFLDRSRHMILRADLQTGAVQFIAGGAVDPDPSDPYGLQAVGEYVALAADAVGNVYAEDARRHSTKASRSNRDLPRISR